MNYCSYSPKSKLQLQLLSEEYDTDVFTNFVIEFFDTTVETTLLDPVFRAHGATAMSRVLRNA
jgi:hypothetical protein